MTTFVYDVSTNFNCQAQKSGKILDLFLPVNKTVNWLKMNTCISSIYQSN